MWYLQGLSTDGGSLVAACGALSQWVFGGVPAAAGGLSLRMAGALWSCSPWPAIFICYLVITFLSLEARKPGFDGWFTCVNECDEVAEGYRRLQDSIVGTGL